MYQFRLIFLMSVLLVTSGYKFRCWWMCQDQTSIQNDYVEQRNRCREYAQLKLDMHMRASGDPDNPQTRKSHLITLFSDCMGQNGWNTTDVKAAAPVSPLATPGTAGKAPPPASSAANGPTALAGQAPPAATTAAATAANDERAAIARRAECAFARQAASVSSLSATRARACDLECSERRRQAPDAPLPAACPTDQLPADSTAPERTY